MRRMGAGASAIAHTSGAGDADAKLRAAVAVKLHVASADVSNKRRVEEAFKQADTDGDCRLSFDEFAAAAHSVGLGVSDAELRAAFTRFDADEDGAIQLDELLTYLFPPRSATEIVAAQQLARMAAAAGTSATLAEATTDVYGSLPASWGPST